MSEAQSQDVLVAVDAGTGAIKAVAYTTDGTAVATATRSVETHHPEPGRAEQSMDAVWDQTAAAIDAVTTALPAEAVPIGVGITGQGDGLWAITADGEPAHRAILWSDSRAAGILEEWEADGTLDTLVDRCGSAPYPGMSLPLLAWLHREAPATFEQIDTILSCKDWLQFQLTGARTTDYTEATVPYLDKTTGEYDRSVFDVVDVPAHETLPALVAAPEVIGTVTPSAATATGLPTDIPVVSGMFDVAASALGTGCATAGDGAVTLGTSLTHQVLTDGPDPTTAGIQMQLGIDDLWTYAIGSNAGTPSLEWAAETLADIDGLSELETVAADAAPGSDGVVYHPYLSPTGERGPFVDPAARGQFIGLTPSHGPAELARAVYEGLSLAIRDCVDHLPATPAVVRLSGGGTQSPFWCQLIADCLDRPVVVPANSEPGATGAAMLLGLGLDRFASLTAAGDAMVTSGERYEPRADMTALYTDLFDLYVDVRETMPALWAHRQTTYE